MTSRHWRWDAEFQADFFASSVKQMGELWHWTLSKYVVQDELGDSEGAKAVGCSHGHFDLVVEPLDNATGEPLFRPK